MKLLRLVVSDFHIGTGIPKGELNPFEDFFWDDRFAELIAYYDNAIGDEGEIELILNGDIFDLIKVRINNGWPAEITEEIATEKLRKCLEGHPKFVLALRQFVSKKHRRIVYLPGNHDVDMWFDAPQRLFRRYVAPGEAAERVRFITAVDTYYLPEGIQIRHGHQYERIHRVDYAKMTRKGADNREILDLPWGTLWILQVVNPAKKIRSHIDRIQPFTLFILAALLFDTRFAVGFVFRTLLHYLRHRVFTFRAWSQRIRNLPRLLREEIFSISTYDDAAKRSLLKQRGVHTLIVGHSHAPRYRLLRGRKVMINTGTWMKMINLNLQYLGQDSGLTYALIEYGDDGRPLPKLMRWYGTAPVCETIPYAD
ncbi:MAG: metallophosphoesterase [Deltaproteobacteria bacterium]|nr:metallophosphoesterase [Deltaproteobacteria bacterium]